MNTPAAFPVEHTQTEINITAELMLSKLINYQLSPQHLFRKIGVNSSKLNALDSKPNVSKLQVKLKEWKRCNSINALSDSLNQLISVWLSAMQQGASLQDIVQMLRCFEIKSFTASNTAKFHCLLLDVLAETSLQQQNLTLNYLLNFDAETRLPNANQIISNIEKVVSITQNNEYVGIFSIQLQLSKSNPIFSTSVNTRLNKTVAEVLQANVPLGNLIHANGNLRFDILFPNLSSDIKLNLQAAKLQRAFEHMLTVENQSVIATPYIGCAYALKADVIADKLLNCARLALETGLSNQHPFLIYSADLKTQLNSQNELENKVLEAFTSDSLTLYLQPIVNLKDAKCVGAELLLRMSEGSGFSIHPGTIVEVLNKLGRGKLFSRWLINSACRYAAELKYEHQLSLYLTINLRAEDLHDFELPHLLLQATALWKISPSDLVLEVTENGVLEHNQTTDSVIKGLASNGFKLALDDFGTGFSSLARLRSMPIAIIKIDQSFVRDITNSKDDYEIVKSIAALANSLGREVIAEGVEDQKCLDSIKKIKIHKCQGYFFAKPMPFETFIKWVKQH